MRGVEYAATVLLIFSHFAFGQTTTKPSAIKSTVSSRPARAEPSERELNDQEKKAMTAALLEARKARIPGAESLQREINNALSAAKKKYDEDTATAIKNLKHAEGDGDRARAAAARQGRQYDDHRNTLSRQNARAAKSDRERATESYERERTCLAEDLQKLKAVELAYAAARETQVFLKFDQLKKATIAHRKSTSAIQKFTEMPTELMFRAELRQFGKVAEAECDNIRMPVKADTRNDSVINPLYDENPEHREQFEAAEKQGRTMIGMDFERVKKMFKQTQPIETTQDPDGPRRYRFTGQGKTTEVHIKDGRVLNVFTR